MLSSLGTSFYLKEQLLLCQMQNFGDAPLSYGLRPCVKPTSKIKLTVHFHIAATVWDHYMTVKSNGGLNQMRTGIADMVAVARIMNATLVIPQLDKRSFWHDSSTFSDIFDELHFIETLQEDVNIVKELPLELANVPRARKHFTSWSGANYYEEMRQLWKEYRVIHVAKSDSRLANNDLPLDIQSLGKKLVERLRARGGRYIALHLRYEKDMLSFTGCSYGLTDEESEELRMMRENTNHWKVKKINSTEQRLGGFCPLTPKEIGIFLRALCYPPSSLIYIAAGKIYGGNTRLLELTSRFPNIVFKETLRPMRELRAFTAVEGPTQILRSNRKTITPDRKGLVEVFDYAGNGQQIEGIFVVTSYTDHAQK
ncbi:hypothetical protein M0R45_005593 [Rubus argutus]|uniref:O-fucosyltransferase family protein n=1 Tax=Rubus argutus TaxID=59490 RepID=A0AAW1YN73_RUBAR